MTTTVPINGPVLRELRIRSGIGVSALAEEAGIGRPYLTKLELGHSKRVSPQVFASLMQALRITDQRVLRGVEDALASQVAA